MYSFKNSLVYHLSDIRFKSILGASLRFKLLIKVSSSTSVYKVKEMCRRKKLSIVFAICVHWFHSGHRRTLIRL